MTQLASQGSYTRAQIAAVVDPAVVVDNGYSVFFLTFLSDGRQARATVTFPLETAPPGGFHMVVNNPGTVGLDDPCALGGTVAAAGLAGYFGARGFVGVTVDYAGLGTQGSHPYLVKRAEATSSLDTIRAAQALADLRDVPLSGRVAVTGLSQGGHATLAVAELQGTYAPELDIRAYAVAAPANVFLEQWAQGVRVAGPHQAYHAMVVYAFNAQGVSPSPPDALWTTSVATQVDTWMQTLCPFSTTPPTLVDTLGQDPAAIFNATFLDAYGNANLAAYPAVQAGFDVNRVRPFVLDVPLRIYQGSADDTVPAVSTQALVAALRGGGMTVDYVEVPGGTHTNVAFFFLAYPQLRTEDAITWLRTQLDAP